MPKKSIHAINGLKGTCKRWGVSSDPIIRFWSKVKINDFFECWEWQGGFFSNGYGAYCYDTRTRKAHRVAWEFTYGKIPSGKIIMHTCDNKKCVNLNHLRIGTVQDNSDDMKRKQRQAYGERNPHAILTSEAVRKIRHLVKSGTSRGILAEKYGVKIGTIDDVMIRSWQHVV